MDKSATNSLSTQHRLYFYFSLAFVCLNPGLLTAVANERNRKIEQFLVLCSRKSLAQHTKSQFTNNNKKSSLFHCHQKTFSCLEFSFFELFSRLKMHANHFAITFFAFNFRYSSTFPVNSGLFCRL